MRKKPSETILEFYNKGDSPPGMGLKLIQIQMALRQYFAADSFITPMQSKYGEKPEFYNLHGLNALGRRDTAQALVYFNKATGRGFAIRGWRAQCCPALPSKKRLPSAAAAA